MSSRSPSSRARWRWPLLCLVLAVAVGLTATFVVPTVAAEVSARRAADQAVDFGGDAPEPSHPEDEPGADGEWVGDARGPGEVTAAPSADAERIRRVVAEHGAQLPGHSGITVLDARDGTRLAGRDETTARIPASNQKLLTALAVAEHVDPYETLATRVLATEPGRVTLVAGGDTLLAPGAGDPHAVTGRAGLDTLAQRTAEALRARGATGPVRVAVDESLFTGPRLNPEWAEEDVASGEITGVAPLALYSHRVPTDNGADPGDRGERPENAGAAAAAAFRARLAAHLKAPVTADDAASSPAAGEELARVESAPVHAQVSHMLAHSDNSLAEVLARLAAARAGHPADVAGVQTVLRESLSARGVPTDGLRAVDASGMALANRVSPATLAAAARELVVHPAAGPAAQGLPIAGGSGTLRERFDDPGERDARGVARAKTGTLLSVVSLTGYVQDRHGSVLLYSIVCNDVSGATDRAKDAVDRTVAALADS